MVRSSLTHCGQDKIDAIWQTTFDIFLLNKNVWIPIAIPLKFVTKDPVNNIPALIQILAWRRPGDKPLSEPIVVSLTKHICVTWPQEVNGMFVGSCWVGVTITSAQSSQYQVGAWPQTYVFDNIQTDNPCY